MTYYVYKISNNINSKVYIGVSKHPEKRFKQHIQASNRKTSSKLYRAIRKYGKNNFSLNTIKTFANLHSAFEYEKELIILEDSIENGYNITSGGEGKCSPIKDETKLKISNSLKTYHKLHPERFGEEHKRRIQKANSKCFTIIQPNGDKIRINNLSEYCRINELDYRKMMAVLSGKRNHHKQFRVQR